MPGGRRASFSGASTGSRSTGHNPNYAKEITKRAALSKGYSTLSDNFDNRLKNDRGLCKTLARIYQECISNYGSIDYCDSYYKSLTLCPDFEKGKYLQNPRSRKSDLKRSKGSLQKKASTTTCSSSPQ